MRIKGLDFLRGMAILLVIFRHETTNNIFNKIGWCGVDLFFVLSGFLVSGLIFKEYIDKGNVNIRRFLIKRSFKIFPPFYFFFSFSILLYYIQTGSFYDYGKIVTEALYVQNYGKGIFQHTWSLAIEEQFYVGFALFIFFCLKAKLVNNKKFMWFFLIGLLLITFLLRLRASYQERDELFYFVATHLRMDGIVTGILASYLFYFTNFYNFFLRKKYLFLVTAVVLISPVCFFEGGTFFMNTIGISSINAGFAIIVLFSLNGFSNRYIKNSGFIKIPFVVICFIGVHSYSIYLWHMTFQNILLSNHDNRLIAFVIYLVLTLATGITLSYLIEKPFLKLRDALYSKQLPFQKNTI